MKIILSGHNLEITDPFRQYVEEKFSPLEDRIERFDKDDMVELKIIVERTTNHHRKGEIYEASADLILPGEVLHAQETREDPRDAIGEVKSVLYREVNKYRTKHLPNL